MAQLQRTSITETRRELLNDILKAIPKVKEVYFTPKEGDSLQYPCIIYTRDSAQTDFASNSPYRHTKRYQVTIIDRDPTSEIPEHVAQLPMSIMVRKFTQDGLNHDIYNLYF